MFDPRFTPRFSSNSCLKDVNVPDRTQYTLAVVPEPKFDPVIIFSKKL